MEFKRFYNKKSKTINITSIILFLIIETFGIIYNFWLIPLIIFFVLSGIVVTLDILTFKFINELELRNKKVESYLGEKDQLKYMTKEQYDKLCNGKGFINEDGVAINLDNTIRI